MGLVLFCEYREKVKYLSKIMKYNPSQQESFNERTEASSPAQAFGILRNTRFAITRILYTISESPCVSNHNTKRSCFSKGLSITHNETLPPAGKRAS
jgi:hypothetical protein